MHTDTSKVTRCIYARTGSLELPVILALEKDKSSTTITEPVKSVSLPKMTGSCKETVVAFCGRDGFVKWKAIE